MDSMRDFRQAVISIAYPATTMSGREQYNGGVSISMGEMDFFFIEDGLVAKRIEKIAIVSNGVVWCGSTAGWPNGLCYYKDGKWTQVSTDDGW